MKRIVFNPAGQFNWSEIVIDGEGIFERKRLDGAGLDTQHYFFSRFVRLIERSRDFAAEAAKRMDEGRMFDAARSLIEPDCIAGEYAEWMLPMFLGVETGAGALTIRRALDVARNRMQSEVRDSIRNYPWKAEGALEFARMLDELEADIALGIECGHSEALEIEAARRRGLTLTIGAAPRGIGFHGYEAYSARVAKTGAALPSYSVARFLVDATGELVLIGDADGREHIVDRVALSRAVAKTSTAPRTGAKVARSRA